MVSGRKNETVPQERWIIRGAVCLGVILIATILWGVAIALPGIQSDKTKTPQSAVSKSTPSAPKALDKAALSPSSEPTPTAETVSNVSSPNPSPSDKTPAPTKKQDTPPSKSKSVGSTPIYGDDYAHPIYGDGAPIYIDDFPIITKGPFYKCDGCGYMTSSSRLSNEHSASEGFKYGVTIVDEDIVSPPTKHFVGYERVIVGYKQRVIGYK